MNEPIDSTQTVENALDIFSAKLTEAGIAVEPLKSGALAPARLFQVSNPGNWGRLGRAAREQGWRWVANWADDEGERLSVTVCLEQQGIYLVLRTRVPSHAPSLPSLAPYYPAADRPERHIRDLFGIAFLDHPDSRRWIRHNAWKETEFPLHKTFPAKGSPAAETPPDSDYPFFKAQGNGVYEIPVGPVHAGIIEPGHFRFQAVGETVLHLEERLGYVHKGVEKIAEGRSADGLARLAGRISGDTTVGHTFAACLAMERAAGLEVPVRGAFIRGILAERERIANHLGDIGAICNDVGFAFGHYQFGRLRELWLRDNRDCFGHRLLMDRIKPGGVSADITSEAGQLMEASTRALRRQLDDLMTILDANSSLEDRLLTTGYLSPEQAQTLGALGYVGRASGQSFDVRRDVPYPPYDRIPVKVPVEQQGDVASRFWLRYKEIRIALRLIERMLREMPEGEIAIPWRTPTDGAEGLGMVESWRGEILCYVRFGKGGTVSRCYPRDPSVINWPALEKIILGNIVPDFPVCNKSVNGSYSGHDL